MKNDDRQLQQAIATGRANKRTVELVQNWCAHVTVWRVGGAGLLEAQTGLPMGMRGLSCPYEKSAGMAAIDLEAVALEYYDANCAGCTHRKAVRMPNFSEVVGRRDGRLARTTESAKSVAEAEHAAIAIRAARRDELRQAGDTARASILTRIDELDSAPTAESAALILENARAVPDKFDTEVQEALFAVLDGGGARARAAFEALAVVANGTQRVAEAALRMLAMREAPLLAAQVIEDRLATFTVDQIKPALPAIFELAAPPRMIFGGSATAQTGALLAAWGAAPAAVRESLSMLLRSDEKLSRILACRVARVILVADASIGIEFAARALQSVDRPDDGYAPGSASEAVAKFLGASLLRSLNGVDLLLQSEWSNASPEQRSAIIGAYLHVLKQRDEESSALPSHAETQSFKRIVDVISARNVDECFQQAIEFLRSVARRHLRLVEQHGDALLGAAALLVDDRRQRYSPLLDPRPTALKAMDETSRRMRIDGAVRAIMDLLGHAGAARPTVIGALMSNTLANLDADREQLRAALLKGLGKVGRAPEALSLVLPAIYVAMMAREPVVRAAGAAAYADVAEDAATDLPMLLHDTFLLLLQDPYVIVHTYAVRALSQTRLPKNIRAAAQAAVETLIAVYSTTSENDSLLLQCIEAFLRMAAGGTISRDGRSQLNTILLRMDRYDSSRILASYESALTGVAEYGTAVVHALAAQDHTFGTNNDDLLVCVGRLPQTEIARLESQLVDIASAMHPGPSGRLERLLEAVTQNADWRVGLKVASAPLSKLSDVPRDRALRRIVTTRLLAVQVEAAIAEQRTDDALGLAMKWSASCAELQRNYPDLSEQWPMLAAFNARARAFTATVALQSGTTNVDEFALASAGVDDVAAQLGRTETGKAYAAYGGLLRALIHLLKWAHAVRNAEQDADRYLRAAKQLGKDVRAASEGGTSAWTTSVAASVTRIGTVTDLADVQNIIADALLLTLPLPNSKKRSSITRPEDHAGAPPEPVTPCVVFVSFTVDGSVLSDPHVITPDELHDLDVTVRVSRWPAGARLVLEALTVEPQPAIGDLPKFALDRPDTEAPHEIRHGGRMLIRVAQPIAARPLEFVYRAYFLPEQPGLDVVVEGERRLRVRSHDPTRNPVTGYRQVDLTLLALRDRVRSFRGIQDNEIDDFLLLLAALGQMAGEALQDKTLPGKLSEADFQKRVREKLRTNIRIGADMNEHAFAAGGITDLSLRGIPIELKVEPSVFVVPENTEAYSEQTAQYTAGSDRRLGVLCVLDCSTKTGAPGSVANDIFLRVVEPAGNPGGAPLLLGVVIIRGNLVRPSDLSP